MAKPGRDGVKKDVLFLGGLVVVAVALIVFLVREPEAAAPEAGQIAGPGSSQVTTPGVAEGSATAGLAVERRMPDDPLAQGDPNAPVVLVMFADYRCPFCAKFSRDTEPELVDRFVSDGTLRLEWRDLPIFGEQSMQAARAGRAAAAQGRFWEFNHAVFAESPERGHADLTEEALVGFAQKAGVPDIERFSAQMRSTEFDTVINADLAQGSEIGVPSTPAFVINGVPTLGAQPTEVFVAAITEAAGQA